MKSDKFLKFSLMLVTALIAVSIFSNIFPNRKETLPPSALSLQKPQKSSSNKIELLIKENKLSDKEAMFYEKIKNP